jgi:glycosyltransferase involved in cell wall biosynthesis
MDNLPRVSIITPSYNQGQFIEETIRSVAIQDYENIEHLVIDGKSTDQTLTILQNFDLANDMRWISEPDEGQVDAIQKGFRLSTGDIICWLNSDDIYLSSKVISTVVSLFQAYPQVDVVTGGGAILNRDGQWVRQTEVIPSRVSCQHLRYRNSILQPATFFKRRVLEKVPLDGSLHYAFDWDFWIRLALHYNFLVMDECWAGYRWWGENKTARGTSARTREQAEVAKRHLGKYSWQFFILMLFFRLYQMTEFLPQKPQGALKSGVRFVSRTLSRLSNRRIAVA